MCVVSIIILKQTACRGCTYLSECNELLGLEWGCWPEGLEAPMVRTLDVDGRTSSRIRRLEDLCWVSFRQSLRACNEAHHVWRLQKEEETLMCIDCSVSTPNSTPPSLPPKKLGWGGGEGVGGGFWKLKTNFCSIPRCNGTLISTACTSIYWCTATFIL